jgi:tetratricopeptide (TPR) repeat protein
MNRTVQIIVLLVGCTAVSAPLMAQWNSTDSLIKNLQTRVKIYPDDYAGFDNLGAAYLQKGRETGDAAYYELAKVALGKSLDLLSNDPASVSAMTHMGVACMAEHRFGDALAWAQNAIALGSGDASPWAIAGDALADMGDYAQAADAYSQLYGPQGSEGEKRSISYERESRMSYLRLISGDTPGAIQLMTSALNTSMETHMPAENIAWTRYQLGEELFQTGDISAAEKAYLAALDEYPGYYRALAGLGKVRTAQGKYSDAADLFKQALTVVPYPEYAAALGDIYQKIGQPEEAKKQYELVEFIGHLSEVNQQIHNRDLALFYADHELNLDQSLTLARKELEVRRDVYTWDVLAWSLFQNGKFDEAGSAIENALAQGTPDPLIFFHAGMIYEKLGDLARAKTYLERALEINPHFHIFYADTATQTLAWLKSNRSDVNREETSDAR